jgi:hypothetical protein
MRRDHVRDYPTGKRTRGEHAKIDANDPERMGVQSLVLQ